MSRLACPDCRVPYTGPQQANKYTCSNCGAVSEWVGPFLVSDGGKVRCIYSPSEFYLVPESERTGVLSANA